MILKKLLLFFSCLVLLSGCWDQAQLNESKLIRAAGFDYTKDGKIKTTAAVPQAMSADTGTGKVFNEIFSAKGNTARQSRIRLDRKVSERVEASKNLIVVFGEEAAKKDIYHILDVFYRDPKSALNARIAVAKGKASDVISARFEETKSSIGIGKYLSESIRAAEGASTVPAENIQTVCPVMFDPGQDFALPYLVPKKNAVSVNGIAIFHGYEMVGKMHGAEAVLFTLLTGKQKTISMSLTKKISDKHKDKILNYASIKVKRNKRTFNVNVSPDDKISAHIKLNMKVVITEYPGDNLTSKKKIQNIENALTKSLTKDANIIIKKLQDMNSDTFGVGRKLIAFHNPTWKKLDWNKEYPNIDYTASVKVKVIGHGIIE
ncbi:Ger(x)C family spore germination protein [Fictibacillus sp. 5RED26]|uniref:Ger(x)C family spore germination protein n=1 Tax=unclassified Fictibacillus TaxID=2644029 RepID=UPI0018CF50E4|nr:MULTISPECIES: Ger(x)C family spore germination protein [unclassified Fictibacillus]MBH0155569.1 Ger(x)C family spore germination protein [Fictibacillus sp. 5RED26]MBH0172762.1 Ger(x)C family spore germination protein [Fictibacillus sp. 23RED33]